MKEFKGTPGPWEYKKIHGENQLILKGSFEQLGPGAVRYQPIDTDSKANRKLIAAAPELLEALQKLLEYSRPLGARIDEAEANHPVGIAYAAIQKAMGESK